MQAYTQTEMNSRCDLKQRHSRISNAEENIFLIAAYSQNTHLVMLISGIQRFFDNLHMESGRYARPVAIWRSMEKISVEVCGHWKQRGIWTVVAEKQKNSLAMWTWCLSRTSLPIREISANESTQVADKSAHLQSLCPLTSPQRALGYRDVSERASE